MQYYNHKKTVAYGILVGIAGVVIAALVLGLLGALSLDQQILPESAVSIIAYVIVAASVLVGITVYKIFTKDQSFLFLTVIAGAVLIMLICSVIFFKADLSYFLHNTLAAIVGGLPCVIILFKGSSPRPYGMKGRRR